MNLSLRLILAILTLITLVLGAGSAVAIHNSKSTIQDELDKNSNLGLNLFSIAVINGLNDANKDLDGVLKQLQPLDRIDTLNVAVTQPNQTLIAFAPKELKQDISHIPNWFLNLVVPTPKEYHRRLVLPGKPPITIRVIPDPGNQTFKVWRNFRLLFLIMLGFVAIAIPLIWAVIRFGLKPLDQVLNALDVVRDGDFKQRLPDFRLTDIRRLSRRFNHMAEVLEEQKHENQLLSTQMHDIQENERRYLARELHDELGQSINGIKSLAVSVGQKSPEQHQAMQSIREICDQMHGSVRNMINQLRPVILDQLGANAAIEKLVDDWNSHHQDSFCALHISGNIDALGEMDAITVYRVVQESLTNVAKHAEAEHVTVDINVDPDTLNLTIEDDGIGIHKKEHYRGRGLPGIRERIHARGGRFEVDSKINQGVKILISLPTGTEDD